MTKTKKKPVLSESEKQRICGELVRREVIYCVSTLVHELSQNEQYSDELLEILTRTDTVYICDECQREDSDEDEIKEHCGDKHSYSEEQRDVEVFEHWIVSKWLANRLLDQGEIVGEFMGMVIWGRTCTGQSISIDNVIETIAQNAGLFDSKA